MSNPRYSVEEEEQFEELVQSFMRDTHYTSAKQASFNIMYAIVNAGIVILPFTCHCGGIALYGGMVTVASLLSGYTSYMLVKMADDLQVRRYEDLGEKAFGKKGYYAISFLQISFALLNMVISLKVWSEISANFIRALFRDKYAHNWIHSLTDERIVMLLGAVAVLPRCFSRSMSRLTISSVITLTVLVVGILSIVVALIFDREDEHDQVHFFTVTTRWWLMPSVISFCFSYTQKTFLVYNCMRRRNPDRWMKSVKRAHVTMALLFFLFGALGFIYLRRTDDDVNVDYFNSYPDHLDQLSLKVLFDTARVAMAVVLLLTVPVDCLVAVTVLKRIHRRILRRRIEERVQTQGSLSNHSGSGGSGNFHLEEQGTDYDIIEAEESDAMLGGNAPIDPMRTARVSSNKFSPYVPEGYTAVEWNTLLQKEGASTASSMPTPARLKQPIFSVPEGDRLKGMSSEQNSFGYHERESNISAASTAIRHVSWTADKRNDDRMVGTVPRNDTNYTAYSDSNSSAVSDIRAAAAGETLLGSGDVRYRVGIPEDDSENIERLVRMSSLGGLMEEDNFSTMTHAMEYMLPVIVVWSVALLSALFIRTWPLYVSIGGSFLTNLLMLIVPSMLYFRLGVSSDYQAIPIFGFVLPHRLYMFVVQSLGILFLLANVLKLFMFSLTSSYGEIYAE